MAHIVKCALGVVGMAALAGCIEETSSGSVIQPAPSGPALVTTMDTSVSDAALNSCRSALDAQTDGAVSIVGSEFSEAATAVYMRVGQNGAPWQCIVASDGRNPSLTFLGSEGFL